MTRSDLMDAASLLEIAQKKGDAVIKLEKRNKERRKKGLPELPDESEREDLKVRRRNFKTKDYTAVPSEDALSKFLSRGEDFKLEDPVAPKNEPAPAPAEEEIPEDAPKTEAAIRAMKHAEAVRRIEDAKNGRINHDSVWSDEGQVLEGGDDTKLPEPPGKADPPHDWEPPLQPQEKPQKTRRAQSAQAKRNLESAAVSEKAFYDMMSDLYDRLHKSFDGLEKSISDLQGRVAEILTSTAPAVPDDGAAGDPPTPFAQWEEFKNNHTPVVFDVGGTKMTVDAIGVTHCSPCITIMSRSDSATIVPKPGARLMLSYTMDGVQYENDPVTFLGTQFPLPVLGVTLTGFIRDAEAGQLDT